jgi:hypothetical protein
MKGVELIVKISKAYVFYLIYDNSLLQQMELSAFILGAAIVAIGVGAENAHGSEVTSGTNNKFDVSQNLAKLNIVNKMLDKKLDNASIIIKDFFINKNKSSAEQTIKIVKEYVKSREEFIDAIKVLNAKINGDNLTDSHHGLRSYWFLNETMWEMQLNTTKEELHKLELVSKLYTQFQEVHNMNEIVYSLEKQFILNGTLQNLINIINLRRKLQEQMKAYVANLSRIGNITASDNQTLFTSNDWIAKLLDEQYMRFILKNMTDDLVDREQTYYKFQKKQGNATEPIQ